MTALHQTAQRAQATPVKGRCGTCDWPTNSLPCPYCTVALAIAEDQT